MGPAVRATLTCLGQRRYVATIGFDPPTALSIHGRVIRISHDDLVSHLFEVLGDPFTLRRRLHENSHRRPTPEHVREAVARRRDALVADLAAVRHDTNLTFFLVQVDGTILHGWSPLLRLMSASSQCGAQVTTSRKRPAASS